MADNTARRASQQTEAKREETGAKAAATRQRSSAKRSAEEASSQARGAARSTEQSAKQRAKAEANALEAVSKRAERAVLIPVGAALVARDNVFEVARPFTSRRRAEQQLSKLQRQVGRDLDRFERRGVTARNQLEREVKQTRQRVERELRERRDQATQLVRRNSRVIERSAGNLQASAEGFVTRLQGSEGSDHDSEPRTASQA